MTWQIDVVDLWGSGAAYVVLNGSLRSFAWTRQIRVPALLSSGLALIVCGRGKRHAFIWCAVHVALCKMELELGPRPAEWKIGKKGDAHEPSGD